MNLDLLLGTDLGGATAVSLCVVLALVLGVIMTTGFTLLWRSGRQAQRLAGRMGHTSRELGVMALWKLERTVRGEGASSVDVHQLSKTVSLASVSQNRMTAGDDR